MSKKPPPFLAQPVLAGDLLGHPAASLRAALAAARRIARKHRLTVAVWQERDARVELVRTIEAGCRRSPRRRRHAGA